MDAKVSAIEHWLIPLLTSRDSRKTPYVIAVSGVQGSGKSTITKQLQDLLIARGYKTAQFSLDDLYLTYEDQLALSDSGNSLWGSRGQFGTHDMELAHSVFRDLLHHNDEAGRHVQVPVYDKSRFSGRGDRAPKETWPHVTVPIDVLIFEGWGVGFQPLGLSELKSRVMLLRQNKESQVARHSDADLSAINHALQDYCEAFMGPNHFDAMVLLQAQETDYVYRWRLQQEHALWAAKGTGMTDKQVKAFVDRYYPSYELYLPDAINGIFGHDKQGHQINLIMNEERKLVKVNIL